MTGENSTRFFDAAFRGQPILAVFRGLDRSGAVARAERAWAAGVEHVEVTLESAAGLDALRAVVDVARERGRVVGAGTVTSLELLDAAIDAGAAYTVSPGFDPEVATRSDAAGSPHLPGVSTATEIQSARAHGFRWTKAFPASVLGPTWIAAMTGPFPDQRFVVTGGIGAHNAAEFLRAGARVAGIGRDFAAEEGAAAVARLLAGAEFTMRDWSGAA